jgi:hypothetical protein
MSSRSKNLTVSGVVVILCLVSGCGVKGDPLPPERPIDIGRGRPTYKRATEKINVKKVYEDAEDREAEDDEN